jgi:large conductance mechanosensitive channel
MLKEFKKFILRGNVVDLAIAVIIGASFTAVVNSLVKDIFTPLVASIFGNRDFSSLHFTIRGTDFMYGNFLNAIIAFLSVAIVLFFLVVQPLNKFLAYTEKNKPEKETDTRECPECLSDIPKKARRCMYCTVIVKPVKSKNSKKK